MKSAPWFLAAGCLVASFPAESQACGFRGRCRGHHHAVAPMPACGPVVMASAPTAGMPMNYAMPQVSQAPASAPAVAPTPVEAVAPAAVAPAATQPTYDYAAGANGQPAYYYTYDRSGKLIIAQWMDWVFRGGRAAGEPAPPLPIIGNLRNR